MFLRSIVLLVLLSTSLVPSATGTTAPVSSQVEKPPIPSGADPALSQIVTLKDLGYSRDETFQGIVASRSYAVNWPVVWVPIEGNSVTVRFSHSEALEKYSSLAVDWNGTRLGSVLLTPQNAKSGELEVAIPQDQIESGYNQIEIELYMGIHEDQCEDPNNPATWATVHNDSFFVFSYSPRSPEPDLALYPLPLVDNTTLLENQVTFVIPHSPILSELSALAVISAKLGQLASWRGISLDVIPESVSTTSASLEGNVIFVGRADRLRVLRTGRLPTVREEGGKLEFLSEQGQPLPPNAGILWEQVSPNDPASVELYVSGANDEALLTAARALASAVTYPRIRGPLGVVSSVPAPVSSAEVCEQVIRFDALGYGDQTAHGTRIQTISFIVPLSRTWQVLTEAVLNLHFAHSALLHPERSSLTVSINGLPIDSILLTSENAHEGLASIRIPARLFQVGNNKISISTNIELLDDYVNPLDCIEEYTTEAWVTVFGDSHLNLPSGPSQLTLDLADYPFSFLGTPNLSDLAFVVPEKPGLAVAKALVLVAGRMGQDAQGETLYPKVVDAPSARHAETYAPYQVLIGMPLENAAIMALNPALPLPFVEGSNSPASLDLVAQLLPADGSRGIIEAALSDSGKPRLIVTGTSDEGILWAATALSSPQLMRDLKGDLVILDGPESLLAMSIRQPTTPSEEAGEPGAGQPSALSPANLVVWLAGAAFVIALGIVLALTAREISRQQEARKSHEL